MKFFDQEKDDLVSTVFSELKILGVKLPKLKKFKSQILKSEKATHGTRNKIFGVALTEQEWVTDGECLLPKFVAMATDYLQRFSNTEIGLFRKAGNVARQKKLRIKLEQGEALENSEPNDVASLLKQWLRELPEPLIQPCLQDLFLRCLQLENEENRIVACFLTCLLLLPGQLHTLKHLLNFMAEIASYSDINKMDAYNLALIMAPNIFATQEQTEKFKSNCIQQYTFIVKLLIDNCDKIGEIPPGITFQYPCLSSELDSSCDILDSNVNKSKKKRRSGNKNVQDIFNGFKKLVGQNGTPVSKSGTPENCLEDPAVSRCASKRKVDPDLQSVSTSKKQAHQLNGLDNPMMTPKQKEKNPSGHVRRKSIGALLRRKDRKRGKSCKIPSVSTELKYNSNSCTITNENTIYNSKSTSEGHCDSNPEKKRSNSGSIKKSSSDRNLRNVNSEFSMLPTIATSFSLGSLPIRRLRSSPYSLRSEKLRTSPISEATLLEGTKDNLDKKMKQSVDSDMPRRDDKNMSVSNGNATKEGSNINVKIENDHKEKYSQNSSAGSKKSKSPDSIQEKHTETRYVSNDSTSHKLGLVRQEGFILKNEKRRSKNSSSELRNNKKDQSNNKRLQKKSISNSSLRKSTECRHKRNTLVRRSLKHRTRHGSLMRGKPNSVKSGLRSARQRSCSIESPLSLNSSIHSSSIRDSIIEYRDNGVFESPQPLNLDLSLNVLLQNFCLSTPNKFLNVGIDTNTSIKLNLSHKGETPISTKEVKSEEKKSATRSTKKERTPSNSDSKIPKTTELPKIVRSSSFSNDLPECKRKSPRLNIFSPMFPEIPRENLMTPLNSDTKKSLDVTNEGRVFDDSCFKTPSNVLHSPDSINWTSGSVFFNSITSPQEEIINKRESIAMILKNNTGHVQAKVHLYDKSFRGSNSVKKNCLVDGQFSKSNQKCYSANNSMKRSTKCYDSISKKSSSKSRSISHRSPLPPPPKFMLTDVNTPSPKMNQPLKEVTNVSFEIEESKLGLSPNKVTSIKQRKQSNSPLEMKLHNSNQNDKKVKRNSFSGQTPYKLLKRVSRSESSPACQRRNILQQF